MTAACKYCGGVVAADMSVFGDRSVRDAHAGCESEFARRAGAGKCVRCGIGDAGVKCAGGTECEDCGSSDLGYAGYLIARYAKDLVEEFDSGIEWRPRRCAGRI